MYINGKNDTIPGMVRGIKENDVGGEFKNDIFDTL
jgi:hypothetical protein